MYTSLNNYYTTYFTINVCIFKPTILDSLNDGAQFVIHVIYIDLEKAFDRVNNNLY